MSELASNSDIENLYYTDSNFLITASNASNPSNLFTTDLFKSFITDQKATDITYNNVLNRYYLCSIIDDSSNLLGYSIIANDPKSTYAQLETLSSVSYALSTIMTDKDGFVFAINSKTSKIAYYSDEDLIGKDASTLGLSSSNLTNDYSGWIDIKNLGNYYCVSKEANDLTIFYAATSKTSINSQRTQVVATEVIIIAAVITLIIAFAFILRNESIKRNKPEDKVKFKKLYYNKYTGARIDGIMLFAVIMVGVLSYFSQSLYSVSNTSTHSEKTLSSINTQMVFEQSQTSSIIEGYEDSYLKKGNSIAYMIKESPNLNDDSALNTLAKDSSVEGIYVFNKDGVTEHPNTNYKDFALSTNPDDQSYAFWDVVKGYKDYVIQDAQIGDNGAYIQYIGVKRQDAKGMIQLAITPSYLSSLLKTTTLKYNLDNYKAANDGIFVDINKADSTIKYYSQSEKLVGDSYTKIGLTEAALNDSYAGYQTISGVKYFVNSLLIQDETNGDYFLYLAIPSISYSQTEFNIALITTLTTLIALMIIAGIIEFSTTEKEISLSNTTVTETNGGKNVTITMPNGRKRVVKSAASRYDIKGNNIPWVQKTGEQKMSTILKGYALVLAIIVLIFLIIAKSTPLDESLIYFIINNEFERGVNLFSITAIILLFISVLVISAIVRTLILLVSSNLGARTETIGRLIESFIKYGTVIGLVFNSLYLLGVNTTSILTSAGILTLVVGFGSQSLIKDIIAGIFIVFEGEFRVGDIVTVGDWRGTVLEIGIRATKIEDLSQNIKIFNNSDISGVVNMTKEYSWASVTMGFDYNESIDRIEAVLAKELPKMKEKFKTITEGPYYKGITKFGESNIEISIIAECKEENRIQLVRDLNRELLKVFNENDISISYPQVVINNPTKKKEATQSDIKKAEKFNIKQKEDSKGSEGENPSGGDK